MMLEFKQFWLAQSTLLPEDEWRQVEFCGHFLGTSKTVPVTYVASEGCQVALILGWAVFEERLLLSDGKIEISKGLSLQELRTILCGRFVLICRETKDEISVYTDGAGLFPVVYDSCSQVVASSPSLIGRYKRLEWNTSVASSVKRRDGTLWYPFGLTPFSGIRRLLPSQYLRLGKGYCQLNKLHQYNFKIEAQKLSPACICEIVSSYIKVFANAGRLTVHLTAGFDSRMVMAAVYRAKVGAKYITIMGPGKDASLDVYIAKRLARKLGVAHEIIQFAPTSLSEVDAWQERVGYCIKDAVMYLSATVKKYDDRALTLTGACGEVGRAFYWNESDIGATGLNSSALIKRLGFLETKQLIDEAEQWLGNYEASAKNTYILDNAYIDLRLACWAGPSMLGHLIPLPTISPFNSIKVYQAMLAIDEASRLDQRFAMDFIYSGSPRLLEERFNAASGIGRLRFIKQELKQLLPKTIKTAVKAVMTK